MAEHGPRFPREVVAALFLETFKVRLDRTLSSLLTAEELE